MGRGGMMRVWGGGMQRIRWRCLALKAVFSWRLLDAWGREVKQLNFTHNFIAQKIEVADLADGIYFWALQCLFGGSLLGCKYLLMECR